jgi:hypothetical protein
MLNYRESTRAEYYKTRIEIITEHIIVDYRERDLILKVKNIILN